MRSQVLEFRLCPNCTALMPVNANRCAHCKLSPIEIKPLSKRRNGLKRALARRRERRFARKSISTGLCPNCRTVIARDARRCSECDWVKMDNARDILSERRRRLVLSIRTALTYKRTVYCTHCACIVHSATNFCPFCQTAFLTNPSRPSSFATVAAHLRRRRAKNAVERATLCPTCDIYLPEWSEQCYCCGWERPPGTNARTAFRYLKQRIGRRIARSHRDRSLPADKDALCPTCDVYVPASDPMCMICGWKPERKRSFRERYRALQLERARRAVEARQKRMQVCEHCDLPLLPGDARCMVCGWEPEPSAAQRLLATRFRPRKPAATTGRQRLCPNCRISLSVDARHCSLCGWDRDPARSWARHPRMIWLVPICLVLYGTLLITFLQMADPLNTFGHVDRYGRTGQEGKIKQLSSARSHK